MNIQNTHRYPVEGKQILDLTERVRILREALAKAERGLESAACYFDDEDSRGTVLSVERSLRSVRRALEATEEKE